MGALILRRVGLIRYAQDSVVLVGAGHDGDTPRLQRFLTRDGYPHRLVEAEADRSEAGGLGVDGRRHGRDLPQARRAGHERFWGSGIH